MIRIDIRPLWRMRAGEEREFDFQLVALLGELEATRKLTQAAQRAGISYRHAWNLIAEWEAFFGAPLVAKARGRGTTLTPLGNRLLHAGRRAQARLEPELQSLASDFERSLNASLSESASLPESAALTVHASHDLALAGLRESGAESGLALDVQYRGSFDAIAALRRGECDVAGFHVPEGRLGELMARRLGECLDLGAHRLIAFATRTQGLIVQPGNPKGIRGVADLCRPGVAMVNRQRGSGTRALLEFLVSTAGLDRARMRGYDSEELTHSAVAAMVAGRQADVGLGVHAAAAQYRLDFVPLCRERYFLACPASRVSEAPFVALRRLLEDPGFREQVARLPGYDACDAGTLLAGFERAVAHTEAAG